MTKNKLQIRIENSALWLANAGFIFPSNGNELEKFNIVHGKIDGDITGLEIDPFKIIKNNVSVIKTIPNTIQFSKNQYQLVAKNLSELPKHIIKTFNSLKNAEEKKDDSKQSPDLDAESK